MTAKAPPHQLWKQWHPACRLLPQKSVAILISLKKAETVFWLNQKMRKFYQNRLLPLLTIVICENKWPKIILKTLNKKIGPLSLFKLRKFIKNYFNLIIIACPFRL